jgi:aminoglycoside phosphotransferase
VFAVNLLMKFPVIKTEQEFDEQNKSEIWRAVAEQICRRHEISYSELKRPALSEHIIFFIDDSFILKIFAPFRNCFQREKTGLEFAGGKTGLKIPEIFAAGKFENFDYMITTQIPGELMTREMWLTLPEKDQISIVTELATGLKELHSHNADSLGFDWRKFVEHQSEIALERQIAAGVNPEWIEKLPDFIETNLKFLPKDCPTVFLHSDVHFGNLRLQKTNGKWQISGLFDFADSICGFHEFDFLAPTILMIQGQREIQHEFFRAYGYADSELNESLRKRLMLMTVLYECSDLKRYALRLKPEAVNYSLEELEKAIWNF